MVYLTFPFFFPLGFVIIIPTVAPSNERFLFIEAEELNDFKTAMCAEANNRIVPSPAAVGTAVSTLLEMQIDRSHAARLTLPHVAT